MAQWFSKIIFVHFDNFWVITSGFNLHLGIAVIEGCNTCFTSSLNLRHFYARHTATTDTTTWASHNFDEVIVGARFIHVLFELTEVTCTMYSCYVQGYITDLYICFTAAIKTTDSFEWNQLLRSWFLSYEFIGSAHSGFHNTTSVTKDNTTARSLTHESIKLTIFQSIEIDVFSTEPFSQFANCDTVIGIAHVFIVHGTACSIHFWAANFKFLSRTRSYAYSDHLLWIDIVLFCEICLLCSCFHKDWRFSSRQVRQVFWIEGFCKLNPTWAARCKLRDFTSAVQYTLNQLRCFFHDGHIRTKVSIQYIVTTQFTEGCDHFTFYEGTEFIAEFFAKTNPNSWCSLENNHLIRVFYSCFYQVYFRPFIDGIKWTSRCTLTAVNADRMVTISEQVVMFINACIIHACATAEGTILTFVEILHEGNVAFFNRHTTIKVLVFAQSHFNSSWNLRLHFMVNYITSHNISSSSNHRSVNSSDRF